jgi:ADP-ribosylation factor GTPase-activating protein 1
VKVDDKYFSKLGNANATRPEDLPPSQGGRYTGFGSELPAPPSNNDAPPSFDELQRDPVKALTKGFGWFGGMVAKTTKQVNDTYISPAAQRIAEANLAEQARLTALRVAKEAREGAEQAAVTVNRGFQRFADGGYEKKPLDDSKKDFWDSFGVSNDDENRGRSQTQASVGTRGMKSGGSGSGGMSGGSSGAFEKVARKDESGEADARELKKDDWDNW